MNERSTSSRRPRFSRGKIAIAVIAAGLIGFGAWKYFGDDANEGGYVFGTVQTGNIEDLVTATGTLEPRDHVDVGAQVSGQIEKIHVEVGDVVKAGDLLATIDATNAALRVESNRASLRSSQTSLETQKNNLEKAERDYKRQQNLYAEDATTYEQLINAETTLQNAKNQIIQSEAQIAQQIANMSVEETNLGYTRITAPIDGTVMSIAVKEGQTINASQSAPTVLRLADLNTMTVRTDVSEADFAKVSDGMPVYFTTLGAGGDRRWHGTVKRREPTPKVQNSVVLYPVLFDVVNEGGILMPSMTAQVFFVVAEARNVLTVPMAALQQGQQIAREMAGGANQGGGPRGGGGGGGPGGQFAMGTPDAPAGSAPAAAGSVMPGSEAAGPGPRGGFGGGQPTPEQMEQMRQRMAQGGGAPGGPGGGARFSPEQMEQFRQRQGGGFGGAGMGGNRQGQQQRRGTVMVKQADGSLEARQVVVGVNDRVYGQVLEGLEEGEEVVIGRNEPAAEAAAAPQLPGNQNFRGGGGFRPF